MSNTTTKKNPASITIDPTGKPGEHIWSTDKLAFPIAASAFAAAIVTLCVLANNRKRARKFVDCGYERRHDEAPREITGYPEIQLAVCRIPSIVTEQQRIGRAMRYVEKGSDRNHQTIGFVKHPTIDEIDHRTIGQ